MVKCMNDPVKTDTAGERMPKVSIIIPVYNGSNYLREAVDSALAQTYHNVEVIVVNDGSEDNGATEEIAKSYGDRIRYFHKPNGGVASALNLGIRVMNGDYFAWLSHDDVFYPEKTELQVAFFKTLGREAVLYSDYEFIDARSRYLRTKKVPSISPSQFQLALLSRAQLIHGCTLLIPRTIFEKVGVFDEKLHTIQDYDLWFRMSSLFDFIHVPKVLISSRAHAAQGTKTRRILWQREFSEFYLIHLARVFNTWNDSEAGEPLSIFSIKAAIKMERFGLEEPARMCRFFVKRTSRKGLVQFKPTYYYWFGYYLLFRLKRFIFC